MLDPYILGGKLPNYLLSIYHEEKKMFEIMNGTTDFEFEKSIAQTNRKLSGIETIFLLTSAETSYISSSIVRDVMRNGGNAASLVPNSVASKVDI